METFISAILSISIPIFVLLIGYTLSMTVYNFPKSSYLFVGGTLVAISIFFWSVL